MLVMKFNNFDDLINYLHGKDFSKLEFEIADFSDQSDRGECLPKSDDSPVSIKFIGLSDTPVQEFKPANESFLLVEDYSHIPDTCSSSSVSMFGRNLFLTICENESGQPCVKIDVDINGEIFIGKEFILTTDVDIGNTIAL